ncbi:MAG: type II secretion system protein GspJ [Candidatus Binatia bacterium]|nr:type II secretion system protein GspJ [Candidatus Binatia bacterium]
MRTAAAKISTGGEAGFSLLELLIAMSLLVVMMTMTYSVFQTAMTAVPRGEEAADRSARLRMATALLTRQVRSMVDYPAETDDEVHSYFIGDEQTFSFVTAAPQLGGGEGLGWVTYASDGQQLGMAERLIFSQGAVSEEAPEESAEAILLGGLKGVRFQYLRLDGSDPEWLDAWDGMEEQSPPAAIRVTLDGVGLGDSYWVQEIPVMTVIYALGAYDSDVGLDDDEGGFGGDLEEDDGP